MSGEKLTTVNNFKYFGAIVSDKGSKPEILARIAQTTTALTKLKIIWKERNSSKIRMMCFLVISIFLYESWTLTANRRRRIQTLEMRYFRRLLNIFFKDLITNEEVRNRIIQANGPYEDL